MFRGTCVYRYADAQLLPPLTHRFPPMGKAAGGGWKASPHATSVGCVPSGYHGSGAFQRWEKKRERKKTEKEGKHCDTDQHKNKAGTTSWHTSTRHHRECCVCVCVWGARCRGAVVGGVLRRSHPFLFRLGGTPLCSTYPVVCSTLPPLFTYPSAVSWQPQTSQSRRRKGGGSGGW